MRQFKYVPVCDHLYDPGNLSVEYMAWKSMYMLEGLKWNSKMHYATLVKEIPGPLYLFELKFTPRGIPETETLCIAGALGMEQIGIEYEDLAEVADNVLCRYLGLFLIFAYGNRYTKLEVSLYWAIDSGKIKDDLESRLKIIQVVSEAIQALGYSSIGEFMPILAGFGPDPYLEERLLESSYYEREITHDTVGNWINWPEHAADEVEPKLKRNTRRFSA